MDSKKLADALWRISNGIGEIAALLEADVSSPSAPAPAAPAPAPAPAVAAAGSQTTRGGAAAPVTPVASVVPVSIDELRKLVVAGYKAGHSADVVAFLAARNVERVTQLGQEDMDILAAILRDLGVS